MLPDNRDSGYVAARVKSANSVIGSATSVRQSAATRALNMRRCAAWMPIARLYCSLTRRTAGVQPHLSACDPREGV